jgi:glycosyltransferase involved in cell wall biosynthesis
MPGSCHLFFKCYTLVIVQKISATIITCNEEEDIRGCLESLKWVDEIVVVDAFSQDNTVAICSEYNAKVFKNAWPGYIKQKNFAKDKATYDWVISLDADERLSDELIENIREVLQRAKSDIEGYFMPRQTRYLGRWIKHSGWYPDYKLRLYNKHKGYWRGEDPHDYVYVNGNTAHLKGRIIHYSYQDIKDHLDKINTYTTIMATNIYQKGERFSILV